MYKKIFIAVVTVLSLMSKKSMSMDIEAFNDLHDYCSLGENSQPVVSFYNAVVLGNIEAMNKILTQVKVFDEKIKGGNTWLHVAVKEQQSGSVNWLLEKGLNAFFMNNERKMPADIAKDVGHYGILLALMEKMKEIYHVDAYKISWFIDWMYPESLRNFLAHYDLRLAHAIMWQNIKDIKQLVYEERSRVNAKMPYFDLSPLMLARYVNNQEIISFLSANGATE